jgi:hypothetical protein
MTRSASPRTQPPKDEMSIETGLLVMTGAFIAVWLIFLIYSETSIAREKRSQTRPGGGDTDA